MNKNMQDALFVLEGGGEVEIKMLVILKLCYIYTMTLHVYLTVRDGLHAKHRQNGRVVFYTPWGVFILYNAASQF
jgi:hypothetical protein